jgi:hypothetical protein
MSYIHKLLHTSTTPSLTLTHDDCRHDFLSKFGFAFLDRSHHHVTNTFPLNLLPINSYLLQGDDSILHRFPLRRWCIGSLRPNYLRSSDYQHNNSNKWKTITAPTGRPRVMRNLLPEAPPRPEMVLDPYLTWLWTYRVLTCWFKISMVQRPVVMYVCDCFLSVNRTLALNI